jgi:hypothetical protein
MGNGITKETFRELKDVHAKLDILFDIIQGRKKADKIIAGVMGGISAAITVLIYFVIQNIK